MYVCKQLTTRPRMYVCMCSSNYSLSLFVGAQPKRQVGEDGEEHEHHHGEADGGECSPALLAQVMAHSPLRWAVSLSLSLYLSF